jgi:ketosteroid isomerase-like protein
MRMNKPKRPERCERSTPASGQVVRRSFEDWKNGTASFESIFAPDVKWEVVGGSSDSAMYLTAQEFADEVLTPFVQRFKSDKPFRPVRIRRIYVDGETVIVIWDGAGSTIADEAYERTYAWLMVIENGQVVSGTAYFDGPSFGEFWKIDPTS